VNQPLSPEFILRLQRQIGNRAVTHFLRRRAAVSRPAEVVLAPPVAVVVPASAAVVETKAEEAVVVPAELPRPLSGWRRLQQWLSRTTIED
jgi:hypothetical protein